VIVVDTGPPVALANPTDRHHVACRAWFDALSSRRDLLIPAPVLAEACYLLERFGARQPRPCSWRTWPTARTAR
jgi:uncharacterized protein